MDGAAPVPEGAAPSPDAPGSTTPLVDPTVLADMARDFSDPAVVSRFARDFSGTLEGKVERLERRIGDGDAAGAEDAVLSVLTSAMMVGAVRLHHAARAVRGRIASDDLDGARHAAVLLRGCAAETLAELRDAYPEGP